MTKPMQIGCALYLSYQPNEQDIEERKGEVLHHLKHYAAMRWLRITGEPKVIIHAAGTSGMGYLDPLDMVTTVGVKAWAEPKRPAWLAYLLIWLYRQLRRLRNMRQAYP